MNEFPLEGEKLHHLNLLQEFGKVRYIIMQQHVKHSTRYITKNNNSIIGYYLRKIHWILEWFCKEKWKKSLCIVRNN